ncbi:MAG: stage II sporulation protein P [Firmicutes bacterium]|nr:stage II sporulation protein P [Bacillota bacterium]
MRREKKVDVKALVINTVLGFVVSVIVSMSAFGYIAGESEGEKEYTWQDAYFGFEDEEIVSNTQPVFIQTLTREEILSQPETDLNFHASKEINITAEDIEKLSDIDYLKKNFYIVDSRTDVVKNDIDAEKFINMDFSLAEGDGPKVLIFHTHSQEMFADSDASKGMAEGIWGAGERLKEILEEEYGIKTIHDTGQYDVVNGKGKTTGAYERMEPSIRKIIADNPTIEVVIDMHRDGVAENVHLVTEQNGKKCAKIMFFNGLCRLKKGDSLESITSLPNPYINENLAFSFNMQLAANKMYPDFTRRVYLNAYRYSLHMMPKSLLVEVGAQTNTKEEVFNSMEILAEILAQVLKEE